MLIVIGKLRLASLAQYLPVPVVGGYLAYIGFYCGQAGLAMMANEQLIGLGDWPKLFNEAAAADEAAAGDEATADGEATANGKAAATLQAMGGGTAGGGAHAANGGAVPDANRGEKDHPAAADASTAAAGGATHQQTRATRSARQPRACLRLRGVLHGRKVLDVCTVGNWLRRGAAAELESRRVVVDSDLCLQSAI